MCANHFLLCWFCITLEDQVIIFHTIKYILTWLKKWWYNLQNLVFHFLLLFTYAALIKRHLLKKFDWHNVFLIKNEFSKEKKPRDSFKLWQFAKWSNCMIKIMIMTKLNENAKWIKSHFFPLIICDCIDFF